MLQNGRFVKSISSSETHTVERKDVRNMIGLLWHSSDQPRSFISCHLIRLNQQGTRVCGVPWARNFFQRPCIRLLQFQCDRCVKRFLNGILKCLKQALLALFQAGMISSNRYAGLSMGHFSLSIS